MNNLRKRRFELGMSQAKLSDELKKVDSHMDVGMISRFENGVCLPLPNVLKALETALQATAAELFSGEDLQAIGELAGHRRTCGAPHVGELVALPTTDEYSAEVKMLLSHLYHDKQAAMSRTALCAALNMPDRQVRELIEQARREGAIIINLSDGAGYYLSDDPDVWERQYRQDTHRALSILSRRKALRAQLKAAGREV